MSVHFSMPSDHRVVSTRRWGRVEGITLAPVGDARGQREFMCFRPGFYLAMGQMEHASARTDLYPSGDFFKLHFRMTGRSRVGQAATPQSFEIRPHTMSTLVQPRDSYKEEHFAAGERERSLTLCCSSDFLRDELGLGDSCDIADPIGPYLRHAHFELRQFPLHADQIELVDALMDAPAADPFRGLYVEAKASALLHSFLRHVAGDACVAPPRMERIRRHLDAHLGESIDLAALASAQGLTSRRLAQGFRQAYGKTVSEYVDEARMRRARRLIESGQHSVTDVAFSVGYGHVANFSTAFKRAFGMSPQKMRQASRVDAM